MGCLALSSSGPLVSCDGRSTTGGCAGAQLAILGDIVIGRRDVEQLQAQVRVLGGELSDRQALFDVLWQERGRQKMGLPGGREIYKSRREVVRRYKRAGDGRGGEQTEFRAGELPPEAKLTECGANVAAGSQD